MRDFAEFYPKWAFATLRPRARLLLRMDRPEEALAVFDIALEYRPDNEALLLSRGGVLETRGLYDEAVDTFRYALEIAPDRTSESASIF